MMNNERLTGIKLVISYHSVFVLVAVDVSARTLGTL